jgi:hydroxymethylbilane synthase
MFETGTVPSVLRIGSRKSDLAKFQSFEVAKAIRTQFPKVRIEFFFKESLGDKNLTDPLWKMPEKGVFTQDFVNDLLTEKIDLVVHSWKDLPTDPRPGLKISGTLPRADQRDVLLFKNFENSNRFEIFSSSPRREKNIAKLLKCFYPDRDFIFTPVRGNVLTRIQKLHSNQKTWGLVVAKAALDRMLQINEWVDDYSNLNSWSSHEVVLRTRETLVGLDWLVLPLFENPTAAAQGGLAIETRENDKAVNAIVSAVSDRHCFEEINLERAEFRKFGGGCHQKIGISYLRFSSRSSLLNVKGETSDGQELNVFWVKSEGEDLFNSLKKKIPPLQRFISPKLKTVIATNLENEKKLSDLHFKFPRGILFCVSSQRAWPLSWNTLLRKQDYFWCAGAATFQYIKEQTQRLPLGHSESMGIDHPRFAPPWSAIESEIDGVIYLTHDQASDFSPGVGFGSRPVETLGTYRLGTSLDLSEHQKAEISEKQMFFWTSFSAAKAFHQVMPQLFQGGYHFCGPGRTWASLKQQSWAPKSLQVLHSKKGFLDE